MSKIVKVTYNAETLQTQITVDGTPFDTSRIDGKEIADWAYPFMLRKVKWDGFYDEMVAALGENEFNLIFEGAESDLIELKEAWEDAPVTIISEEAGNVVTITYDEKSLSTEITVNGQPFDTSRIDGKEIDDWIYPFMLRKVKWDGIFEELTKAVGSDEYTINFSTSDYAIDDVIKIIMSECPETVNMIFDSNVNKKNTATVASPETSNESLEELNEQAKAFLQNGDLKNAFACFKKAAENGLGKAQYNLGRCYYYGEGIEQDYKKAFKWFMKAAEQGIPQAQSWVGSLYEDGEGVKQDYHKAFEWYMKAAKQGHDLSQYHVGRCYHHGKGVSDDGKKALNWYKKAAEQGNVAAQSTLGCLHFFGDSYNRIDKNMSKAIEWLTQAAAQNDVRSMILLEELHRSGVAYYGFNPDIGIANELIERAVAISLHNITETAQLYMDKHNYKRGAYCYTVAAENGDVSAQYELAHCYEYGNGVDRDDKKAFEWYMKAAENNDDDYLDYIVDAQFHIGRCYEDGKGINQDYKKAFEWFMKAADQNDKHSKMGIALAYYHGNGVEQSFDKAYEWFVKYCDGDAFNQYYIATNYSDLKLSARIELLEGASRLGYAPAKEELERLESLPEAINNSHNNSTSTEETNSYDDVDEEIYDLYNFFIEDDYQIASDNEVREKFERVDNYARQGNPAAQYVMSVLCLRGIIVEEDERKAIVYLRKSADGGFGIAEYWWGKFLCEGYFAEKNPSLGLEFIERAAAHGYAPAKEELERLESLPEATNNSYNSSTSTEETNSYDDVDEEVYAICDFFDSEDYRIALDDEVREKLEKLENYARHGNPVAQFAMSDILINGDVIEQDEKKGLVYLRKAAEGGFKAAEYIWGKFLCYGEYVEKNLPLGLEFIKRAANQGHVYAQVDLADVFHHEQDYENTAYYLEQAAEQGHAGAMWRLGIMHYCGLYYNEDKDTAMKYINNAAELGFADAICDIADEYFYGEYYEGDVPYAISLYERALETDEECSHALFKLGMCYYLGIGKQKDEEYGLDLIRKASDLGEDDANGFLSELNEIQAQAIRSEKFLNNVGRAIDIAQSIPVLSEYIAPIKFGWDIGKRIGDLLSGEGE